MIQYLEGSLIEVATVSNFELVTVCIVSAYDLKELLIRKKYLGLGFEFSGFMVVMMI